jgi:hypothetical protein
VHITIANRAAAPGYLYIYVQRLASSGNPVFTQHVIITAYVHCSLPQASAAIAAELDRLDTLLASVHKSAQQQHGRLHHTASQSSRTPATSEAGVRVAGGWGDGSPHSLTCSAVHVADVKDPSWWQHAGQGAVQGMSHKYENPKQQLQHPLRCAQIGSSNWVCHTNTCRLDGLLGLTAMMPLPPSLTPPLTQVPPPIMARSAHLAVATACQALQYSPVTRGAVQGEVEHPESACLMVHPCAMLTV